MTKIVEVLQRELGITREADAKPILATVNVAMCTVFVGYDENNKIGFLGHFDFPCNTKVLPILFEKLSKISERGSTYNYWICGGNKYGWAFSGVTRNRIHNAVRFDAPKYGLEFNLQEEKPYLPLFKKISFSFDTSNGQFGRYPQRTTNLNLWSLITNKPVCIVYEPLTTK